MVMAPYPLMTCKVSILRHDYVTGETSACRSFAGDELTRCCSSSRRVLSVNPCPGMPRCNALHGISCFCAALSGAVALQSLDYKNPERKDFWDALMVVAEAELKEARKQDEVDRARLRGMREPEQDTREDTGVQAAVDMDVQIFLTGEQLAHILGFYLSAGWMLPCKPCAPAHTQQECMLALA